MTSKLPDAVHFCLDNYIRILKNFPPEGQKLTSRYYETDCLHAHNLNKLDILSKHPERFSFSVERRIEKLLVDSLDLGDRKFEISECLLNIVSNDMRKLDMDLKNIKTTQDCQNSPNKRPKRMLKWAPTCKEIDSDSADGLNKDTAIEHLSTNLTKINKTQENFQVETNLNNNFQTSKLTISDRNEEFKNYTVKTTCRTRRSKNVISESSDSDSEIEPSYCICEDVSYGSMVCCDNDLCPIEWFHFGCVSLTRKPKGKWYCPRCRGINSKIMKPRNIFFEELKEYNRQKEENFN